MRRGIGADTNRLFRALLQSEGQKWAGSCTEVGKERADLLVVFFVRRENYEHVCRLMGKIWRYTGQKRRCQRVPGAVSLSEGQRVGSRA